MTNNMPQNGMKIAQVVNTRCFPSLGQHTKALVHGDFVLFLHEHVFASQIHFSAKI